jgi:hypothetical protein
MRSRKMHDLHVELIKINIFYTYISPLQNTLVYAFSDVCLCMEFGGWIAGCVLSVRTRSGGHDAF